MRSASINPSGRQEGNDGRLSQRLKCGSCGARLVAQYQNSLETVRSMFVHDTRTRARGIKFYKTRRAQKGRANICAFHSPPQRNYPCVSISYSDFQCSNARRFYARIRRSPQLLLQSCPETSELYSKVSNFNVYVLSFYNNLYLVQKSFAAFVSMFKSCTSFWELGDSRV